MILVVIISNYSDTKNAEKQAKPISQQAEGQAQIQNGGGGGSQSNNSDRKLESQINSPGRQLSAQNAGDLKFTYS